MADLERTNAGWQLLIDGCEKQTLPRSTTPVDELGQGLLGFYKPPSDSEIMQHKLAHRCAASGRKDHCPSTGCFSTQLAVRPKA